MRDVIYALFGSSFSILTAWAIGTLLIRKLKPLPRRAEEPLLAFLSGYCCLTLIAYLLNAAGFARMEVFLALGLTAILLAFRSAVQGLKWPLLIAALTIVVAYAFFGLPPHLVRSLLTHPLSLIRGSISAGSIETRNRRFFLFPFLLGGEDAADLVYAALIIALLAFVLCLMARGSVLKKSAEKLPTYTIGLVVLIPWVISFVAPSATMKAYFRHEKHWIGNDWTPVNRFTDHLCGIGLLRPLRIEVEPGISYVLDPRDLIARNILRWGEWQPEIWKSLVTSLHEGGVFLDVGAHIGYFSIKAAPKVGKTGNVVSFEPNPRTLPLLVDNVKVNRASNIIVEPIACSDREQMLTLYAAPEVNTGASSLSRDNANLVPTEPPVAYQVQGRRIDDVMRELSLSRVDAIKVDVEGAELIVLQGATSTLKRFHPKVVVEVVPRQLAAMNASAEQLISLLKSAGYNHSNQIGLTDWEWTF